MAEDASRREVVTSVSPKSDATLKLSYPRGGSLPPLDVQQLWFSTLHWDWSLLVLVPAGSKLAVVWIAKALAQMGNLQNRGARGPRIRAEGASLAPEPLEDMTGQFAVESTKGSGERFKDRTILALDPILSNPEGIPVVRAADAALLCVELGRTDIAEAKRTVQLIGHDRFKGCLIIR